MLMLVQPKNQHTGKLLLKWEVDSSRPTKMASLSIANQDNGCA